jgi:adenine phosphoribosyltransferase
MCFLSDIMPLIQNSKLLNELCHAIANHVKEDLGGAVDAVAGLEARGFLFGPSIAILLDVPFIPIRKNGKLPGKTIKATYIKEYGEVIHFSQPIQKFADFIFLN